MKLTRKQFLAALTLLTTLPAKLPAFSFKPHINGGNEPPRPQESLRDGPWLADGRQAHWVPVRQSVHPTAQRLIARRQSSQG